MIFNISTEGITINRSYNPANALQDKIKYKKTKTKTTFDSLIKLEGEWAEGSQWRRYIIALKDIICHGLCMMIGFVYSLLTRVTPWNLDSRSVCAPTIRQYSRDAKGTASNTILSNGNRTGWSPIRSVIIRVSNKIGRPRNGSPICLITSMITDRIGRHEVLLPVNHDFDKICDILGSVFESKHKKFRDFFG